MLATSAASPQLGWSRPGTVASLYHPGAGPLHLMFSLLRAPSPTVQLLGTYSPFGFQLSLRRVCPCVRDPCAFLTLAWITLCVKPSY